MCECVHVCVFGYCNRRITLLWSLHCSLVIPSHGKVVLVSLTSSRWGTGRDTDAFLGKMFLCAPHTWNLTVGAGKHSQNDGRRKKHKSKRRGKNPAVMKASKPRVVKWLDWRHAASHRENWKHSSCFPTNPRTSVWQHGHLPTAPEQGESFLQGFLLPADPRLTVSSKSSKFS